MRAEILVATHTNTDFDAFAAMLAARRLYPGAVVCLAGSLNRNVREFYRLHADELDFVVDASRLELDAVRRLIVVETLHAGRLGELEPLALDPAVDKVVFDHHGEEELPGWAPAENVVISEDGATTGPLLDGWLEMVDRLHRRYATYSAAPGRRSSHNRASSVAPDSSDSQPPPS